MEIKINGFTFRLEFTFLILLSFAVLYGYDGAARLILFSLLHEAGHIAALILFGAKPYYMNLSFYGFSMKYKKNLSALKEFFVLLSGPAVNLALYAAMKDDANLVLFLLNIFPASPLDGGRILRLFFPKAGLIVTFLSLIALLFLSLYLLFEYKIYSLLLITVYLIFFNFDDIRGLYEKNY